MIKKKRDMQKESERVLRRRDRDTKIRKSI
jgi:hypothetical protein